MAKRLTKVVRDLPTNLTLGYGSHPNPEAGMCFMEAVSFVTGGQWTDAPACVSPLIQRLGVQLNDRWSDLDRQFLVPYIPRVIGTNGTAVQELQRRWIAVDWVYRTAVPKSLRLAGLDAQADALLALAPITTEEQWRAARPLMNDAYNAASERRAAARASIQKQLGSAVAAAAVAAAVVAVEVAEAAVVAAVVAAEVAVVAVVVEVVAAEVAVVAAEAVEISRALARGERASWLQPVIKLVKPILAQLPPNAGYWTVRDAIYWPVRTKVRELLAGDTAPAHLVAYRDEMRVSVLNLLDRLIAVTATVSTES